MILGAGASAELGFPLGSALLSDISTRVDISYEFGNLKRGDHVIAQALRSRLNARDDVTDYNQHLHSAWQISKSSQQGLSIDNVLDALEDPKASLVGKFGIVRSILAAEERSTLSQWVDHFPAQMEISALNNTWLDGFTKLLTEGRKRSELPYIFENLTIINFNYDRTIEQYLPFSIANYFGVPPNEIRAIIPNLPILRPYGKAGSLPWQGEGKAVEFGHSDSRAVETAADCILTFTEQIQDGSLLQSIKNAVRDAERIIFMGFGFHRQNLKLLEATALPNVEVLATSAGVSKTDCASIEKEIEDCLDLSEHQVFKDHKYVRLFPMDCSKFIPEVWRTLTASPSEDPRIDFPNIESFNTPSFPRFSKL